MVWFKTKKKLIAAIQKGDKKTLAEFLDDTSIEVQQLFLSKITERGRTPLMLSIHENQPTMMNMILEKNTSADVFSINDEENHTPLTLAASRSIPIYAEALLKAGADPDQVNKNNGSPIYIAAANNHIETCRVLIAHKADIQKISLLTKAIYHHSGKLYDLLIESGMDLKLLLEKNPTSRILHYAAEHPAPRILKDMLDAGFDINLQDNDGKTPLHCAIAQQNLAAFKLLLQYDAKTDLQDKNGYTALERLQSSGFSQAISFLHKHQQGTDTNMLTLLEPPTSVKVLPLPRAAAEAWSLLGDNKIAKSGSYPEIQKRLTEIFNFETHDHITIIDDLATSMQSLLPEKFDQVSRSALLTAYKAYQDAGGSIEESAALGGTMIGNKSPVAKSSSFK